MCLASSASRSNCTAGNLRAIQLSKAKCMNRFARIGETADPCGVPLVRSARVPSGSCSGAASHRFTYSSTQAVSVTASTALTMRSPRHRVENFWTSRSMTQSFLQHRCRYTPTASRADRRGR